MKAKQPARKSRSDVVTAALRLLDSGGLADLSMRNIAASLDLQVSALYWHFPNKQSLLAAVADQIVERAFVEPPADARDWRVAVRTESWRLRTALLSVADGAEIVASTIALGLGQRPVAQRLIGALRHGEFADAHLTGAATALLQFIVGNATLEQQRRQAETLGLLSAARESAASGERGELTATPTASDEAFEFGLTIYVRGLELIG